MRLEVTYDGDPRELSHALKLAASLHRALIAGKNCQVALPPSPSKDAAARLEELASLLDSNASAAVAKGRLPARPPLLMPKTVTLTQPAMPSPRPHMPKASTAVLGESRPEEAMALLGKIASRYPYMAAADKSTATRARNAIIADKPITDGMMDRLRELVRDYVDPPF